MNWLVNILIKEARGRRFNPKDRVRFFTNPRKGKGQNIVLTPNFQRGEVVDYRKDDRRYTVRSDDNQQFDVHPRNIVPETFVRTETAPISVPLPPTQETII